MFATLAFSASAYTDNYPNTHRNTGQNIADLIAVARTQLGYQELNTSTGYPIAPNASAGYTKYGASFGDPTGEWCAYFVSWCATNAGIPTSVVPRLGNCAATVNWYKKHSEFYSRSSGYNPKTGDIVFFNWSGGERAKHIGIVTGVSGNNLYTIEGNTGSDRGYMCCARTRSRSASYIVGYGVPAYNDAKTYVGSYSFAGTVSGNSASMSDSIKYTTSKLSVVTTTATQITSTSATLHGEIANGGRLYVSNAGFFFGTDKLQLAKYPVVTASSKSELKLEMNISDKVGALTPNTTYYYRSYACIDGRDYVGPTYAVVTVNDIPQKLVLSQSEVNVGVGQTAEIMAAQLPVGSTDKGITWTSADEKIATVTNEGVVKGVSFGKVKLTAKTNYGSATAECTVNVLISSPQNLELINDSENSITVKWDGVSGATGYVIYRADSSDSEPIELARVKSDVTEYTDTQVTPGTRYYYTLKTLAELQEYDSDLTSVAYATPRLKAPENVSAENHGALIKVQWSKTQEADKYKVYRASSKDGIYMIVAEVSKPYFTDCDVLAGTTYFYKIAADNGNVKTLSNYSETVSITAQLNDKVDLDKDESLMPPTEPKLKKPNDAKIVRSHMIIDFNS